MTTWASEHGIEISAAPAVVWVLLADSAGWKAWSVGIDEMVRAAATP
ncbi:MAG: hypothetical protein JSS41_03075 [Proteobacteria bacterium]|nr:hypothetical protein [Pseudomonadota bacterium]